MALTNEDLPNGGKTARYTFQYEKSLKKTTGNPAGPEPARTNALIAACEADLDLLTGWFGGVGLDCDVPVPVNVTATSGGASWSQSGSSVTITLNPGLGDSTFLRYLLVSEMDEQLMRAQNKGWFGTGTEGSQGEGLSRFLAAEFLAADGLGSTPSGYGISDLWLRSSRGDSVNNINPGDSNPTAASGCSMLFLYYLYRQLGFEIRRIVVTGGTPLSKVYQNLTADDVDPFPDFKQVLDDAFPPSTFTKIGGANPDNPYPLPTPRRLSMRRAIATFPQPDAVTARQVLTLTGEPSLRPALNRRRRQAML